jgi:EmrB/QacA subfamily drug resistance transporter
MPAETTPDTTPGTRATAPPGTAPEEHEEPGKPERPAAAEKAAGPEKPAAGHPLRWLGLAVVLAVEIMDLLDTTIVGVASPSIQHDLGGGSTAIQWISAAYTLSFAVFMITGARLGDILGRRLMFLTGVGGFTVCSALCAAAVSPGMLIGCRVAQGVFAAAMVPQGLGILRQMFPPKELGAAFGIFGPVMGLASVGGPVLGGYLTDADLLGTGWRAVFLVNLPLGVLALLVALRVLPEGRAPHAPRLDVPGMVLVGAGVLLLVYPLVQGREQGWPAWIFVMMGAALPVLWAFARWQRRTAARGGSPLVEPGLFAQRGFSPSMLVGLLFFAGMSGMMLVVTLHLQLALGYTAQHAGATMIPFSLGIVAGSALSGGWLGPRYGRPVLQSGAVLMAGTVVWLAWDLHHFGTGAGSWQLAPALATLGVAMGLVVAPFFDIAMAGVDDRQAGSASGVLNAVQQLAGSVGVAVLGTIFFSYGPTGGADGGWVSLLAAAGSFAAMVLAAWLMPRRARPHEPEAAESATAAQSPA